MTYRKTVEGEWEGLIGTDSPENGAVRGGKPGACQ